jgi:hypothetical protein
MLHIARLAWQYSRELTARRQWPDPLPPAGTLHAPKRWFHSIDLGEGLLTKGDKPNFILRGRADVVFRHGVAGKTVLDIGAWDGFYSFEAERRGAARVLATDHSHAEGLGLRPYRHRPQQVLRADCAPAFRLRLGAIVTAQSPRAGCKPLNHMWKTRSHRFFEDSLARMGALAMRSRTTAESSRMPSCASE